MTQVPMRTAVLLSGGLDSAVLLADEASRGEVWPIYVSAGLAWEGAERELVRRFLATGAVRVQPLVTLRVDMTDVYSPSHWAVAGAPPAYHTADQEVYLPGRNIVLLSKAGVHCALQNIGRLVLGTLDHNPFPDATAAFRSAAATALSLGLAHQLNIDAPYASMRKADVIRQGLRLNVPMELTLSCMNPRGVRHCGLCSKCRERHDAFVEAAVADPTDYADRTHIGISNAAP